MGILGHTIIDIDTILSLEVDFTLMVTFNSPQHLLISTTMLFNTQSVLEGFNCFHCQYVKVTCPLKL